MEYIPSCQFRRLFFSAVDRWVIVGKTRRCLFLWLSILVSSLAGPALAHDKIDSTSRVRTEPDGTQSCIECERPLDFCECSCPDPQCAKPYRIVFRKAGASANSWAVDTEDCCQCHLDIDSPYYCVNCYLTIESCYCYDDTANLPDPESSDKENRPSPNKKMKLSIDSGDNVITSQRPDNLFLHLPRLPLIAPGLQNSGGGLASELIRGEGIVSTRNIAPEEVNTDSGDTISGFLYPNTQLLLNTDNAALMPVLNQIFSDFNVQIIPDQPEQTSYEVAEYVSFFFPVNTDTPKDTLIMDQGRLLHVVIINDEGILRLVLVFCLGQKRLLAFRNIHGSTEVHVTDSQGLQTFISTAGGAGNPATLKGFHPCVLITINLEQPVDNLDDLWAQADKEWEKAHPKPKKIPVIKTGYVSTRKKHEKGIIIDDQSSFFRKSVSNKLREKFDDLTKRFRRPPQVKVVPTIPQASIESAAITIGLTMLHASPSETPVPIEVPNQNPQLPNHFFDFKTSFMSDEWLTELHGNPDLVFVISPRGSAVFPLVVFVTLSHVSNGLCADQINLLSFANNADFNISETITLPKGGFLHLLKGVIARIDKSYQIRVFQLRDPTAQ